MPTWLTYTLLIGLGAIFVLMPVHAFISTWGGTAIGPLWLWKSWKELLVVVLVLATLGWLLTKPAALKSLIAKPLPLLVTGYVALTLLLALIFKGQSGTDATMAALAMNLRYLGVAALTYVLFSYTDLSMTWIKRACWFIVGAGVTVSVMGIIQIALLPADFLTQFGYNKDTTIAPYLLIDDNPDHLRAFATLRGPNDFGAFLILPLILVALRAHWRRPLFVVAAGVLVAALILSGSRSAWIGAAAAFAVYGLLYYRKKISFKQIAVIGGATVLLGAGLLYAAVTIPALRMAVFHSSPGDPSLTEGSTDNHIAATVHGIERVVEEPLGCGPGCAGPASYHGGDPQISENYFVQIAEETGLVGLALFAGLIGVVALSLYQTKGLDRVRWALLASLAGYVVIGLLLHVWADDPLSITWWLLAGAVLGYNERQQWKRSKNSSHSKTS